MQNVEILPSEVYELDSYMFPGRPLGRVIRVDSETLSWYDDQQDGGHFSDGMVLVELLDGSGEKCFESLEYASEHWDLPRPRD